MRIKLGDGCENRMDLTTHQRDDRRRTALERHVIHFQTELDRERAHRKMLESADTRRTVKDLAWPRSGESDEVFRRPHRHRRMHAEHADEPRQRGDAGEVLYR